MNLHFLLGCLSIVFIDLLLAGDNAVVIALAVRELPRAQRRAGIATGASLAVALRVGITFFAARLLETRFLQLAGGALVLWIAVRLFQDAAPDEEPRPEIRNFWRAIRFIVLADFTMSTDNILAVAAASKGSFFLLLFGLGLSIPFVITTSTLLSILMDRFPLLIYAGAAILGKVGGEMILTDSFVVRAWHPSEVLRASVEVAAAGGVVLAGKLLRKRREPASP